MNDSETRIYFVAVKPDIVKGLGGGNIYFTPEDAQDVAEFWQSTGPWRVYQAVVTKIEEYHEAQRDEPH